MRLLLEDIGITVQNKLDLTTNYLIVGGPLFYDEEGEPVEDPIHVLNAEPKFELVRKNKLGSGIFASPAICGGQIFLRTTDQLCCIVP